MKNTILENYLKKLLQSNKNKKMMKKRGRDVRLKQAQHNAKKRIKKVSKSVMKLADRFTK